MINMQVKSRNTKQKRVILEVLKGTDTHPTADWIYEEARKVLPDISLGTVYRNLRVLTENNMIQELNYGSSHSRYDGNPMPHYHFVCNRCQRVFDVPMDVCHELNDQVEAGTGWKVEMHRLEFYGVCSDCQQRASMKN